MRAAPHRPVRIVPTNQRTDTRRRSTTAEPRPSANNGGSLPRSTSPIRSRYGPRGLPWSKIAVPLANDTRDLPQTKTTAPFDWPEGVECLQRARLRLRVRLVKREATACTRAGLQRSLEAV